MAGPVNFRRKKSSYAVHSRSLFKNRFSGSTIFNFMLYFYRREKTGVRAGDLAMSFKSIFQDVRNAVDYVHIHGDLKSKTIENMDLYLKKDDRLPMFLSRIRDSGAKIFILTNSDYNFTDQIMNYLFDFPYGAKVIRLSTVVTLSFIDICYFKIGN